MEGSSNEELVMEVVPKEPYHHKEVEKEKSLKEEELKKRAVEAYKQKITYPLALIRDRSGDDMKKF